MNLVKTLKFCLGHPLNREHKSSALARWMRWQATSRLGLGPTVVPFVNGSRLLVARGMAGATGNVYCGLHEFEDMAFVLHFLRSSDLFMDVGANVGAYTIIAGAGVGCETIAVEPVPSTFAHLRANIALNFLGSRVHAENCGLAGEPGHLSFSTGLDTVNHVLAKDESAGANVLKVEVKTLDGLLAGRVPQLIKLDAEGFETPIVAGAEQTFASDGLAAVVMELNGSGTRYGFDDAALHKKMLSFGFSDYSYEPFQRKLVRATDRAARDGNTLFIKNADAVTERLRTAEPFDVPLGRRHVRV